MSLVFQTAPCELNGLSGHAVPDASGELNPLAPGDPIAVFGFVLSYSKLYICFILKDLRLIPWGAALQQQQRQQQPYNCNKKQ